LTTSSAIDQARGLVPESWIRLACDGGADALQTLWAPALASVPVFVKRLVRGFQAAVICEGASGLVLAYHLVEPELGSGIATDRFFLGSPPVTEARIAAFESEVGTIPPSLRALWLVHGFVGDGLLVASLDERLESLSGRPTIMGVKRAIDDPADEYECLAVADVEARMSYCFTRRPGTREWIDRVVEARATEPMISPPVDVSLDWMLAGWPHLNWSDVY
jgi:hypothetical protein